MKKLIVVLFLLFAILMCGIGCQKVDKVMYFTAETAVVSEKLTQEPYLIAEPEILQLLENGATRFCIVYDETDELLTRMAKALLMKMQNIYNISMQMKKSIAAETSHEIVLGDARHGSEELAEKIQGDNDYLISVSKGKLYFYARTESAWRYLLTVFEDRYLSKIKDGNLNISSDQNFQYSCSELMAVSFLDYQRRKNGKVDNEFLKLLFETRVWKDGSTEIPYRLYLPYHYNAEKKYPVLLVMHGAGQRGSDNQDQLRYMVANLFNLSNSPLDEAIVICPQCPVNEKWVNIDWTAIDEESGKTIDQYELSKIPESNELEAVVDLLQSVLKNYPADQKRVYVTGLSMGGMATWNLVMNHPDLFTAAVPMCGIGDPATAGTLKHIPIWVVHGTLDGLIPVTASRKMVAAIQNAGGTAIKFTEIPKAGHDCWSYGSSLPEIWQWLFSQKSS